MGKMGKRRAREEAHQGKERKRTKETGGPLHLAHFLLGAFSPIFILGSRGCEECGKSRDGWHAGNARFVDVLRASHFIRCGF